MQETQVRSLGWEDPLRRAGQAIPVSLPGKSHGQKEAVRAAVHGVAKSWTQLSD